jgi:hypothetical protein
MVVDAEDSETVEANLWRCRALPAICVAKRLMTANG